MADIKQTMFDIERCICHVPDACRDCSHYGFDRMECMESLLKDALELLKEQEAVEPKTGHWFKIHGGTAAQCTICKCWGQINMKFCPWCGAKMET